MNSEINDSIKSGVVKTYRDIISPVIEATSNEGSKDGMGGTVFGFLISGAVTAVVGYLCLMFGLKIPIIIAICVVVMLIMMLIFPFNLKQRIDSLHKMQEMEGMAITELNDLKSIDDSGLIFIGNRVGYLLKCIPNAYNDLANYCNDFSRFIELFSRFSIEIKGLSNNNPIGYIDTDKLTIYKDTEVLFDRLELARWVDSKVKTKSSAYIIYLFVHCNPFQIDELDRQLKEAMLSTYKRAFSKIEVCKKDELMKASSRDLLVRLDWNNMLTTKVKKSTKQMIEENMVVRRIG